MYANRSLVEIDRTMGVGRDHHWMFRVLTEAPMIDKPLHYNNWLFIPENQDNTLIPYEASKRVDMLREMGIKVVGTIVAHEAPKELSAPKRKIQIPEWQIPDWRIAEKLEKLGQIMAPLVLGLVAFVVYVGLGVSYLLMTAVMVDPALIAVVEDENGNQHWIEVASWL